MVVHRPHVGRPVRLPGLDAATLRREPIRLLDGVWHARWRGAAVAAGTAALTGLLVALAMPRGPITTAQTLAVVVGCLAVGVVAGLAMRSRWAMLLAPVAHVAVFEVGRLGTVGPLVDGIQLNTYGILAFVLGRGFYGLVALLPMVLGVAYGAGLGRRLATGPARPHGLRRVTFYGRRALGAVGTVALVSFVALLLRPASTPTIVGADGERRPGSVAELTEVRLGGHDQWLTIRGASVDNPVLLHLAGGPGQTDLAYTRVLLGDLEQDFVVVNWDQRGSGKSYPALDPAATWTLDQAVADTLELTNVLRERFDEEKIYVFGESWGTILGVLAVQRQPELFHAYIGTGQMVNVRETDRRIYREMLAYAERTGDDGAARQMREYGEPPYADIFANAYVSGYYEKLNPYTAPEAYVDRGEAAGIGPWGILASEYTLIEKVNVLRGLMDSFAVMYPQIQEIDFQRDAPRLDVPVYILDGRYELRARHDLARAWFDQLQAPVKRIYVFEYSGHSPAFEEFARFRQIMIEMVLPETYPARVPA